MMSEKVDKLMPALLKVKSKMEAVRKDAKNPFFKSKYAGLNNYLEGIEPLLQENGLVLLQPIEDNQVASTIVHAESGQYITSSMTMVCKNPDDMQQKGSAATYARRYTLSGLLAFQTEEDNDGEGAMGRNNFIAPKSTPAPTAGVQRGFGAKSGGDSAWNN